MKKAVYLTTMSEYETMLSSQSIMDYCKENNLNLQSIVYATVNKLAYEPEKVIQHLKQQNCDIAVSDDDNLIYSDIDDFETGFLQEMKDAGIECVHVIYDRPMLEMARYVNMKKSEFLVKQQNEIHGLIVYKGNEENRKDPDFQNMKDILKEHLNDNRYGVLYYQQEGKEFFDAFRSIIANNPLDYILMKESFISEEGLQFTKQMNDMRIEFHYLEDMQEQENLAWQMKQLS